MNCRKFIAPLHSRGTSLGPTFIFIGFILIAGCSKPAFAQETGAARFELIHESGDRAFTTISLQKNGLALIREKPKSDGDKRAWEVVLLDTLLNKTWETEMPLESNLSLTGYESTPGEVLFLFRKGDSNLNDLHLLRIHLFTHVVQQYTIKPNLEIRLTHFIVVNNSAIFGGYVTRQPAMLMYDMATERMKVVPGFFVDNTELLELKANRNSTFNALLVERGHKEKKLLVLKTFDESGSLLLEDDIEIEDDKTLIAGTTSSLENDDLLLAGVWGTGGPTYKQASGLFSVLVDPFNKQAIQYQEFPELKHFLDYMSKKRAMRTKNKADRRRKAEKPPVFRVNVNVVRMEETEKGFALLCEVYNPSMSPNYPYYNNNAYTSYNSPYYNPYFYGNQYMYNPMTMNRYYNSPYSPYGNMPLSSDVSILHSALILFDRQGKVNSDYSFPLKDVKLPSLEQVSDFYIAGKYVQFYKKERNVLLNYQGEKNEESEQDTIKIELKSTQDVIRKDDEDQGGVRYWFGSYGYVWGYEAIKNKAESYLDPVRYVYYINKVRLD